MEQVSRVHIFEALQALVNDVLLVNVLKNVSADNRVQVSVHEIEDQIDIPIILRPDHILQPNDVFMSVQLLQKHNLAEGPLSVRCILKRVKILFHGHDFL